MNTSAPNDAQNNARDNEQEFEQLLLAGYVLGNLDAEESRALEQLLSSDPALRQELAALQMSLDTVYGQEVTPPPALKASVLAAAEQAVPSPIESSANSYSVSSRSATESLQRLLLIATGVLTALSLYLGVQNNTLRQALRETKLEQAAIESENGLDSATELVTYSLDPTENATENEQTSSVELSTDRDRLEAVLAVRGLPTLPEDQVYALWTVVPADAPITKDAQNAILTAVFTVDQAGNRSQEIVLPAAFRNRTQIAAIAITIEDAEAPEAHESSPILIHRL
ncbi:MAG: anti-sigma factor [Cyanobacteria bacterium P01_D01_bin.1]